jgi:hypothetical protein
MYEKRIIKPVEIVLREGRGKREMMEGTNIEHTCKYYKVSPCTTIIC